jgi:hypothetical protein
MVSRKVFTAACAALSVGRCTSNLVTTVDIQFLLYGCFKRFTTFF